MAIAIFAGSFDPMTNGHLEVITKASEIFEKVIVAVAFNENKQSFLPMETRLNLIREVVKNLKNVEVDSFLGLTVDYAKKKKANVLIRGLRSSCDYEYELQMAQLNEAMNPNLKTLCLISSPQNSFISSSGVKEILKNGGDISGFVPKQVLKYIQSTKSYNC